MAASLIFTLKTSLTGKICDGTISQIKDLLAMYSTAFWRLFVVSLVFWLCCVTTVTPFIEQSDSTSFYERSNSGYAIKPKKPVKRGKE